MFDPGSNGEKPSLLMAGRRRSSQSPNENAREAHAKAKAERSAKNAEAIADFSPSLLDRLTRSKRETVQDAQEPFVQPDVEPSKRDLTHVDPSGGATDADQEALQVAPQVPFAPIVQNNDAPLAGSTALIDPATVINTVWRWRWPIVGSTVLGGLIGVFLALSMEREYTAASTVLIDPREIKLVDRDLTPEFLANEAALSIVDSRLRLASSSSVLERVIERTGLTRDTEFNGEGTGAVGVMTIIRGLLGGSDSAPGGLERITLENLRNNMEATRTNRTFLINIAVQSAKPEKAALLANEVAQSFIDEQANLQSDSARQANEALSGRLDTLRQDVEQAERRVEAHRRENNLFNARGRLIAEDQLLAANSAATNAKNRAIEARSTADAARQINFQSVVEGAVPTSLVTPALTTFRAQYASLKQQSASLENQLGPRHPRLENIKQSVAAVEDDIRAELRRIVSGTQADLRAAIQNEQQTNQELANLKASRSDTSPAVIRLLELEREAAAARQIYESTLLRFRETGELGALPQQNARIVSEAEVPLHPSSTSRKIVVAGTTMAGFIFGFGAAVLAGLLKSLSSSISGSSSSRNLNRRPFSRAFSASAGQPNGDDPDPSAAAYPNMTSDPQQMDENMYPYPPYAPYPMQQSAQQAGYPQQAQMVPQQPTEQASYAPPTAPYPYPQPQVPMSQTPMNPAPMGPAPMPQLSMPQMPMAQAPVGYPPQMPVMGQPYPQQMMHPMPTQPHGPMPQQVPMPTTHVHPVIMPVFQQPPAAVAPTQPQAQQQSAPTQNAPQEAAEPNRDVEDLRESVRDIKNVVDILARRRQA
ncbi:MAG: GNVR domain-containing protein [Pseudomonadota bacterium]